MLISVACTVDMLDMLSVRVNSTPCRYGIGHFKMDRHGLFCTVKYNTDYLNIAHGEHTYLYLAIKLTNKIT